MASGFQVTSPSFSGDDSKMVEAIVRAAMRDIVDYAEHRATALAPARTGNLRRNIKAGNVRKIGETYHASLSVGKAAPYGKWVEKGTGIFGAFHRPIVPKTGNVLVFKEFRPGVPPNRENIVFARSVKGQRGQHFIGQAYKETRDFYVPQRLQLMKRELSVAIWKASGGR